MPDFPPQLPHGKLQEILPDVFFVTGQILLENGDQVIRFSRNMVVLRDGVDLTIVNTLRLDEAGLAALDALGNVRTIVRLGAYHGRDDAFYIEHTGAAFWAAPETEFSRNEKIDQPLVEGPFDPLPDANVFRFETARQPEAILHIERNDGILICCDSLQNWAETDEYFDEPSAKFMTDAGFIKPANIGPGWQRSAAPDASDFARLKSLRFRHMLSAHGAPLLNTAPDAINTTIKAHYGV